MIKLGTVIAFILLFGGCSQTPTYPKTYEKKDVKQLPVSQVSKDPVTNKLHAQYKKWHHAPYKYGGVCLDGVDCSGLVKVIYRDAFNLNIPRSTKDQVKIGKRIKYTDIKPGDMIFFKTGHKQRHVGIYFGDNTFLHTSADYGVIISSFNNPYWREKYLMSRRVLTANRAYAAKN